MQTLVVPNGGCLLRVNEAVITDFGGPIAYTTTTCRGTRMALAEKLEIRIWSACNGTTTITPWASNVSWRAFSNILGSPVWIAEADMVTVTRHSLWECNKASCFVRRKCGAGVSSISMSVMRVSPMGVLIVWSNELKGLDETKLANGCECQSRTYRPNGKMPRKWRLMKDLPSNMSTAKMGTMAS